jgi:hypothetical protein
MNKLLDECLNALGVEGEIVPEDQRASLIKTLITLFPFTNFGTIEWSKVRDNIVLNSTSDALIALQKRNKYSYNDVFIIWDEGSLPCIKSNLDAVFREIDEVTPVSFDTWILNLSPTENYVIEFHHDNGNRLRFI